MTSIVTGLLMVTVSAAAVPIESGSVLFLQDSNKIVAHWTDADITHVALALRDEGQVWVYEAAPSQVRRLPLADYCQELAQQNRGRSPAMQLWVMRPQRAWTPRERAAAQRFLDAQLGRRYSLRNYVRNQPGDGVHCAELASSALQQTGRYVFPAPYTYTPTALVSTLSHSYDAAESIPLPSPSRSESWHQRTWKRCRGWADWCSWSCYETWTFCW